MDFKEFKEHGARSGLGTILAHRNIGERKYHITCVTTTVPSIFGSQNTIEWSSTSNSAITQIPAKKTTESVEIPFLWNADNVEIMKSIRDKEIDYAVINLDDGTGWKFKAKASYRQNEASADNAREGTLQLTITSVDEDASDNLLDLFIDTITFNGSIPQRVELEYDTAAGATQVAEQIVFTTDPTLASADVAVTTDAESGHIVAVTKSVTDGEFTITLTPASVGDNDRGYCYVTITATKKDANQNDLYAPASRKIYVITSKKA